MEKEIYRGLIANCCEVHKEDPTTIHCTEENNGYAVFLYSFDEGTVFLRWFGRLYRDEAIEFAVEEKAIRRAQFISEQAKDKP